MKTGTFFRVQANEGGGEYLILYNLMESLA
jgi:hypothetical protein